MCLSVPARIEKIDDNIATVSMSGNHYNANISLLEDAKVGDYVLMHAGFAIQVLNEKDALETIELIRAMNNY